MSREDKGHMVRKKKPPWRLVFVWWFVQKDGGVDANTNEKKRSDEIK